MTFQIHRVDENIGNLQYYGLISRLRIYNNISIKSALFVYKILELSVCL